MTNKITGKIDTLEPNQVLLSILEAHNLSTEYKMTHVSGTPKNSVSGSNIPQYFMTKACAEEVVVSMSKCNTVCVI